VATKPGRSVVVVVVAPQAAAAVPKVDRKAVPKAEAKLPRLRRPIADLQAAPPHLWM